ncbi:hypothetical protein HAX54_003995 [Datura stramonium]|uniref:Dihydrolipoyl dehydrogenase n=1 Tax=Datura stramonium TaxID=4076 RepID=A0ABS8WW90_DATST|nr:hypothetical protein [Datura stramonium]
MAIASLARRKASTIFSSRYLYSTSKYSFSVSRGFASGSDENDVVVMVDGWLCGGDQSCTAWSKLCIEKRGTLGGRSSCHDGPEKQAVAGLTRGIEGLFKKNKVNYVKGYGKFLSPSEVSVDTLEGGNTVKGKNIIIATGSDVKKSLPGLTIDEKRIVSSTGALALTEVPKKLVVWCWVHRPRNGICLGPPWLRVDTVGDGVKLTLEPSAGGDQTTLEADVVLVSAGRVPFTSGLGLDKIGKEGHVDYDLVPGVVYTHPEVASVGKTEEQVKALGVDYRELIHEAVLALHYGASSEDIARTCHAHPTMSEALKEAAMATYDKPIHI